MVANTGVRRALFLGGLVYPQLAIEFIKYLISKDWEIVADTDTFLEILELDGDLALKEFSDNIAWAGLVKPFSLVCLNLSPEHAQRMHDRGLLDPTVTVATLAVSRPIIPIFDPVDYGSVRKLVNQSTFECPLLSSLRDKLRRALIIYLLMITGARGQEDANAIIEEELDRGDRHQVKIDFGDGNLNV